MSIPCSHSVPFGWHDLLIDHILEHRQVPETFPWEHWVHSLYSSTGPIWALLRPLLAVFLAHPQARSTDADSQCQNLCLLQRNNLQCTRNWCLHNPLCPAWLESLMLFGSSKYQQLPYLAGERNTLSARVVGSSFTSLELSHVNLELAVAKRVDKQIPVSALGFSQQVTTAVCCFFCNRRSA